MAIYKRYRVEQKYIDGIPQEEYRLGEIYDDTPYHSLETCEEGHECILEYRWIDVEGEVICEGEASYHKQKRQQKCNTEDEWVDVYPQEFRRGELISEQAGECGAKVLNLYLNVGDGGTVDVNPNNPKYSYGETVTLTATPNSGTEQAPYYFTKFMYGSTQQYENETTSPTLTLTMYNDMFVKAIFGQETGGGYLYYSYPNGVESYYYHKNSTLDKSSYDGGFASIIRDNEGVVTSMRYGAFMYASYLEEIYFPNLSSAAAGKGGDSGEGPYADTFTNCISLKTAYIPKMSVIPRAFFSGCVWLNSVTTSQVESIGCSAFHRCQYLKSIDLPQLKHTEENVFAQCTTLSYVSIPKLEELNGIFLYCSSLSSIDCPNVSVVHHREFWYCRNLSDVYFGWSSVVDFQSNNYQRYEEPFYGCHSSLRIHIPASLCGAYNERYCGDLCPNRYVTLSGGVSKGYSQLFVCDIRPEEVDYYYLHLSTEGMGSLSVVPSKAAYSHDDTLYITPIPNTGYSFAYYNYGVTSSYESGVDANSVFYLGYFVTDWWIKAVFSKVVEGDLYYKYIDGTESFYNYTQSTLSYGQFSGSKAMIVKDLTGVVKSLPMEAFYGLSYLTEVYFPAVTYIGTDGIASNPYLSSISLPQVVSVSQYGIAFNGLTNIDLPQAERLSYYAIYGNGDLQTVNLPKVSWIGNSCFTNCGRLTDVYLGRRESIVTFNSANNTFDWCSSTLKIHVPSELYDAYISKYGYYSYIWSTGRRRYYQDVFVSDL